MPVQKRRLAPGNCNHCGIDETMTSLWRTGLNKEKLCNACGLYVQTHGRMRPLAQLGGRKKAEAAKVSREAAAAATTTTEPKEDPPQRGRPAKLELKPRQQSAHSSMTSSNSFIGYAPYANVAQDTRHSRSASISTTASSSLPSPAFSTQEFPSPPRTTEDSPPPSSMSASLGRLDELSMSQIAIPADNEFQARAKKGQKRHSISSGSSLGFPLGNTNSNHVVLKVPQSNKKKARFDQQPIRPLTSLSSTLPATFHLESHISQSVPLSSPIKIPPTASATAASGLRVPTVCLPCSKCAELLPLRSSSVPLSEDPVCERCSEGPKISPSHHHHPYSSSSVPVWSNHQFTMSASYPAAFPNNWDADEAEYEFVSRPRGQTGYHADDHLYRETKTSMSASTHQDQDQDGWSLEEEFSFLDTSFNVDADGHPDGMEDTAPLPPQGWGGPFFRNMPMPPPKMVAPLPPLPPSQPMAPSGGNQYPFASFMGAGGVNSQHRAATTPDTISSSSTSPRSPYSTFNSGYPSPIAGLLGQPQPPIHPHPQPYPPVQQQQTSLFLTNKQDGSPYNGGSPLTSSLGLANLNLAQRRGITSAKFNLSSAAPPGFLQAAQNGNTNTRLTASNGLPSPRGLGGLEFLVRGAPSPGDYGQRRSHLGLSLPMDVGEDVDGDDGMDLLMMDDLVSPAK
ncbi:Zinc finger, NHR/GATA-type [Phaffia rhodozyma]|uniref:Zinc finger, NHR/GATA-type n=1 Tax=Phaffia rhodozyma TaxID=264483 RepID=A0A0F7SFX7_PHARH|nr:Zinc finger, NHR/GATA-type [Phaffia rhodozyma]